VSIEVRNYVEVSPYDAITDDSHHELTLHLGHIQADVRDIAFYFNKKPNIPKIKDSGIVDVPPTARVSRGDRTPLLCFQRPAIDVHGQGCGRQGDSLKFSIGNAKHTMLYNTLGPLATGLETKQIEEALSDALRMGLEYVGGQLMDMCDRVNEAKTNDEGSRTKVLQEVRHVSSSSSLII
jgi:hypothetical protein